MTTTPGDYKIGDRVVFNSRNPANQGRQGTITYKTGVQYWVRLDESDQVVAGVYSWSFGPAAD